MKEHRLDALTHAHAPDDYEERLEALQRRLRAIQVAYITQGLTGIVMLEGWDAAGKGGIIKRLTTELDPRFVRVHPISAPTDVERRRHFLYRFWTRLPGRGELAVFDRSWYGRVAVERVEELCPKAEWKRSYAAINDFERELVESGIRLVKLFLHVTAEEQDRRLLERLTDPWKRWKTGPDDYRNRAHRPDYADAYEEMFERTDTEIAPWNLIAADHKKAARLQGLTTIADTLEQGVDLTPLPADPELLAAAEKALGVRIRP